MRKFLSNLLSDVDLDEPEVGSEFRAGEIVVRDPAVAVDAPPGRPGSTDEEHPDLIAAPNVRLGGAHLHSKPKQWQINLIVRARSRPANVRKYSKTDKWRKPRNKLLSHPDNYSIQ